jgi:predicted AlkP superfamily pyrophosphatase or phosphodiesterase
MKKVYSIIFILVTLQLFSQAPNTGRRKETESGAIKPKLVVAIVVDQFRYDYLLRFKSEYTAGIEQLLAKGAVFVNARYDHFPTFTSVGHAAFLTGAYPSVHGIIGNQWYDRDSSKTINSAADDAVNVVGGAEGSGTSPRNLLVSTIGDEMKIADKGQCKVIGISLKDYAAIFASGHMADGVFWFDTATGNFVSSNYYVSDLPDWVKALNARRLADRYKGIDWLGTKLETEPGQKLNAMLPYTPFGNELIQEMAEAAIKGEQLGQRSQTDLLVLSYSSNDYVGHQFGPDSTQVHEMALATDRLLGRLFAFLDAHVGMANVTVVLVADHGVDPMPEVNAERKMPGGRIDFSSISDAIQKALVKNFGRGKWIIATPEDSIYLNWKLISSKKLNHEAVDRVAAQAALEIPHVSRVYTREQLMNGFEMGDAIGRRVMNGFSARRGADLYVLLDPYYLSITKGTSHGTPFGYDAHVPVIFMGPGIKAGKFSNSIIVNDVAPTLAKILDIEIPSGAEGRILSEIFALPK